MRQFSNLSRAQLARSGCFLTFLKTEENGPDFFFGGGGGGCPDCVIYWLNFSFKMLFQEYL